MAGRSSRTRSRVRGFVIRRLETLSPHHFPAANRRSSFSLVRSYFFCHIWTGKQREPTLQSKQTAAYLAQRALNQGEGERAGCKVGILHRAREADDGVAGADDCRRQGRPRQYRHLLISHGADNV